MKKLFFLPLICLLFCSCTTAVKPRMETYLGRAVVDVKIETPPKEVVGGVYDSLSVRSGHLTKTVAFMPADLPDQPGSPNIGIKSMGIGITTFALPQTTCDGASAILGGFDNGVSSRAYGTSDYASYTSCIYPYKQAYRIYVVGNFMSSSSGGLGGLMADAIKKEVAGAGKYENIYALWFDSIVKKMRDKFPDSKEIEISMP